MSRSLPFKPSAITSALAIAWIAAACGHSQQVQDAFESAKNGNVGTGNTGNGTAGNSNGTAGSGPLAPSCSTAPSQQFDSKYMEAYYVDPAVTSKVETLLNSMSREDRAIQMMGIPVGGTKNYQDIERSPDVTVGGTVIRGYNYRDAGHGVNLDAGQPNNRATDGKNYATVFPAASVRAASWDLELEYKVGEASGDETAASKNNMLLAPCMNIIRHPYWGRTQETYSEDSYHTGRMATAYTVGLQKHVVACAKHFAANNIELQRSTQNAIMNEQTLREIYGRHFEMVIQDGGVGCIMASYNAINGVKNTQNEHLLRDILKAPVEEGGFGYQGLVLSDWWAMPGDDRADQSAELAASLAKDAVKAGLDIEVPWQLHYTVQNLTSANVDQALVRDAARRVLIQKFRFNSATQEDGWSKQGDKNLKTKLDGASIATTPDHEAIAEESEVKSAVLLKNGDATPVLPLTSSAKSIAVLGPDRKFTLFTSTVPRTCLTDPQYDPNDPLTCNFHFATDAALGDRGSSRVNGDPARTIGPFQGIKDTAGADRTVASGNTPDAVPDADTLVVVVGYTAGDEGEEYAISEGGDRFTLNLPAPEGGTNQNDFVSKVLDRNKPTIIIVNSGSIVNLPWLAHANKNQATIWAGYGGMRVGAALGKLIFGQANFSGKMPMSWPTQAEQDKLKFKDAATSTNMGYFFGYREYDRRKTQGPIDMVFPFGHGLSYSKFEYANVQMPCQTAAPDAIFNIKVDVKNTSTVYDGDEVVMAFVKPPKKPDNILGDRPIKELKSFARVSVPKGGMTTAELPLRIRDLRRWAPDAPADTSTTGKWVVDPGTYTVLIGKNADDAETSGLTATFTVN